MSANYPLSPSQEGIWTGQKLNPDSCLYNMAWLINFDEPLDSQRFRHAFQDLIRSSDNMRTSFHEKDGKPFQSIQDEIEFDLEVVDFKGTDAELRNWAINRARRKFDLSVLSFDSVLLQLDDGRSVCFLNQHHLITDAWATTLAYKRLFSFYRDSAGDENYPSHESHLNSLAEREEQLDNSRPNIVQAPDLFGKRITPRSTASKRITIPLSLEQSQRLRSLSGESPWRSFTSDLSLYNLFSTLLFVYINKISGQDKLIFGAPAHNRSTAEQKNIVASFIELFPMQADLNPDDDFRSLGKKAVKASGELMRNAKVGGSSLKSQLAFNCILNFVNTKFEDFGLGKVDSEWLDLGECDPRHLIRWHVYDYDDSGRLDLLVDFNDKLPIKSLEDERERVSKLISSVLINPGQKISSIDLVSQKEKDLSLIQKEDLVPSVQSIIDRIVQHAKDRPDAVAIEESGNSISYSDLVLAAASYAKTLPEVAKGEENLVAIHLARSSSYLLAILACWIANRVVVLLDENSPKARTQAILSDSGASCIITEEEFENMTVIASPNMNEKVESLDLSDWSPDSLAYILYTSGSSGTPKGVVISHLSFNKYISWSENYYEVDETCVMPFFTSPSFDLSLTSMILPLVVGGTVKVYPRMEGSLDDSILSIVNDNDCNLIKLTPSHLEMIRNSDWSESRIEKMILGGEDLKVDLVESVLAQQPDLIVYNEYGPTEATVGCIVHRYKSGTELTGGSVPIGEPIAGVRALILSESRVVQIPGVPGELYLGGSCLADSYWKNPKLSQESFLDLDFGRFYKTGDKVRVNEMGKFEFLGRIDEQIKLRGFRIEPGEIESVLLEIEGVESAVAMLEKGESVSPVQRKDRCVKCGLPTVYPKARVDENGVCFYCRSFESYQAKTQEYFGDSSQLREIIATGNKKSNYDCLLLYSGGKDSTYALSQMVDAGYRVLAFTLDNGYISDGAKSNIKRVVDALEVDHIYGQTEAMNQIFVDSLNRHANVCNGCFKTIYTLSTKLALEKEISFIVTGLSRGQFFETRLTEELFEDEVAAEMIDLTVLEARKAYHQVDDAVKRLIDVSMFEKDETFEKVRFIDFYRYNDVSYADMMSYLDEALPWVRPSDTGRSTNCLINDAGIYVHKKSRGYHNYAFPYSWDVRVGHKTIDETVHELEDELDEDDIFRTLNEIGFDLEKLKQESTSRLLAFVVANEELETEEIFVQLRERLPTYMIPQLLQRLSSFPLTGNGKVDKQELKQLMSKVTRESELTAPRNGIEEVVHGIWKEVLNLGEIGVLQDFLDLGGNSLIAIQVVSRINDAFEINLALRDAFEAQTIEAMSKLIESTILTS